MILAGYIYCLGKLGASVSSFLLLGALAEACCELYLLTGLLFRRQVRRRLSDDWLGEGNTRPRR